MVINPDQEKINVFIVVESDSMIRKIKRWIRKRKININIEILNIFTLNKDEIFANISDVFLKMEWSDDY